ncbi:BTB (POZ) domain containing 6 [Aphelenchoides avenae]|nr:BTB (POZ) domain containing 6 [Aphelenchus avenae]
MQQRREFLAHKLLPSSVSDVLEAMFYGNFPEEEPVKIEDTTVGAFEAMLEFIYTGAVSVDSDSVFPLLYLAKKYLLDCLASRLLEHFQSFVNESTVAQLVLHGQNYLCDASHTFWTSIEANAQALLESEAFTLLQKSTVVELLQRNLEVQETLVFDRVVAWAEAECQRKDLLPTPANVRTQLDGVIRLVRFPLMSSKEFTSGPFKSDILTQEV